MAAGIPPKQSLRYKLGTSKRPKIFVINMSHGANSQDEDIPLKDRQEYHLTDFFFPC